MADLLTPSTAPLVLIVDDDSSLRSLLKLAMKGEGYRTEEAVNGQEGLHKYQQLQPDIVLLDAMMPEMDGFTCCQQLRQLPQGENATVLMITFLDDQESVDQAFAAGATDYITKPIHWGVLSQRVRRLIQTQQAQMQLRQQQAWENLLATTLKNSNQSSFSLDLEATLSQIQNLLNVDAIVLACPGSQILLESLKPNLPSAKSLSFDELALSKAYSDKYQAGLAVSISDLQKENLTSTAIAPWLTLQRQALLTVPLWKNQQLHGLLSVQCQSPRIWDDATIQRLSIFANLFALILK
ncbi:MAG: response regulator [Snowella sp.]|nr:response regulator [Snowella sp.]